jgi:hypothetical protein
LFDWWKFDIYCLNKCPCLDLNQYAMQDQYPDGKNLILAAANSWAAVTKGHAFQFTATKVALNHADTTAPTTMTATATGSDAGALTIAPLRQRRRLLLLALRSSSDHPRLNKNNDLMIYIYTSQSSPYNCTTPSVLIYKAWANMAPSSKSYFGYSFLLYYITCGYEFILIGKYTFDYKSNHVKFTRQQYKVLHPCVLHVRLSHMLTLPKFMSACFCDSAREQKYQLVAI